MTKPCALIFPYIWKIKKQPLPYFPRSQHPSTALGKPTNHPTSTSLCFLSAGILCHCWQQQDDAGAKERPFCFLGVDIRADDVLEAKENESWGDGRFCPAPEAKPSTHLVNAPRRPCNRVTYMAFLFSPIKVKQNPQFLLEIQIIRITTVPTNSICTLSQPPKLKPTTLNSLCLPNSSDHWSSMIDVLTLVPFTLLL